jgi:hypothetical protein
MFTINPYYTYHTSNSYDITATSGTAVQSSSSANTYGSWTEIHSGLLSQGKWVTLNIHSTFTSNSARNSYFDFGVGPDSSNVTTLIEKLAVNGTNSIVGATFMFPLYIPKNQKIWAKHQCSVASITGYVMFGVTGGGLIGLDTFKCVSIEALGSGSSTLGTTITPGNAAQGSWTEIVSSTSKKYVGFMISPLLSNDASRTQYLTTYLDIGYGSNGSEICIGFGNTRQYVIETDERISSMSVPSFCTLPAGTRLVARANGSGAPDTYCSVILYGMVG